MASTPPRNNNPRDQVPAAPVKNPQQGARRAIRFGPDGLAYNPMAEIVAGDGANAQANEQANEQAIPFVYALAERK